VSRGVNIYPQALEDLLINHDKVADVAVFGVPSAAFGEQVKAVVQPVDWADATDEVAIELLEWLRDRIAPAAVPSRLEFSASLPRADSGTLHKRELQDAHRASTPGDDDH
jgi:long-chain acyl-CoA synthetase